MTFEPRSTEEITDSKVLPGGECEFEVVQAHDDISQAGNEMIVVEHRITKGAATRVIKDYLLSKRMEKLRGCCAACGLLDKYERGVLSADDFVGKKGRLKLVVQRARQGYGPRNVISEYVAHSYDWRK